MVLQIGVMLTIATGMSTNALLGAETTSIKPVAKAHTAATAAAQRTCTDFTLMNQKKLVHSIEMIPKRIGMRTRSIMVFLLSRITLRFLPVVSITQLRRKMA
jgi:hypothetical protein